MPRGYPYRRGEAGSDRLTPGPGSRLSHHVAERWTLRRPSTVLVLKPKTEAISLSVAGMAHSFSISASSIFALGLWSATSNDRGSRWQDPGRRTWC